MLTAPATARYPVLLVPGWSDRARALHHLYEYLHLQGWATVRTLEFRDRYGSNHVHALEIAEALGALSEVATGRVDIIAHSMGGLAVRRCLRDPAQQRRVRRVIFLGTPHRGTWVAWLAWGDGGREMRPGSRFLRELNSEPLPPTVRALTLRAPFDVRVVPGSSAALPAVEHARIRFATHRSLLRSRAALQRVRDALLQPDLES